MATTAGRSLLSAQEVPDAAVPADTLTAEPAIAGAGHATCRARRGCCGPKGGCFAAGAVSAVAGLLACVIPVYFLVIGKSGAEDGPSIPRAPRAPAGLNATATISSLALSWSAPPSDGRLIVHYELRSRATPSSAWSPELGCRPTAPSCTLRGLAPAQPFQLSVRAFSTACCTSEGGLLPGEWSAAVDVSTQPEPVPAAPHHLRQAFTAPTLIAVMWESPANLPETLLSRVSFAVQIAGRSGGGECTGWRSVAGAMTPGLPTLAHFASLDPSTLYCVRVSASSPVGASEWSAALHAATSAGNATVPTPPTEVNATPSFTSVHLTWRPPPRDGGASILDYQAECVPAAAATAPASHPDLLPRAAGAAPLHTEPAVLLPAARAAPQATNPGPVPPAAAGVRRAAVTARLLGDEPGRPPVFEGGLAQPQLSLPELSLPGFALPGLPLRGVGADGPFPPAQCSIGGSNASSCTALGAAAGAAYRCRVRALNSVGPSAWSSPVQTSTLAATVPDAPGVASASASDPLLLRWAAAAARGTPVLAYELQARDWWAPSVGWVTISNGSQPELDTGDLPLPEPLYGLRLLPGVPYPLRVRAMSRLGPSLWGPESNLTIPQRGGCGLSDERAFRDAPAATKAGIQSGLLACVAAADQAACAQRRIQQQVGLSAPCAACWVQEGLCSIRRCMLQCLQPASAVCARCSEVNCFPACVLCSGMPEWAFPPP